MCMLAEVTKDDESNETSGKLCAALLGTLVVESQFRMP